MKRRFQRAFLTGLSIAIILVVMLQAGLMLGTSLTVSNIYYTSTPLSDSIVIVAINNDSLNAYGRSPVEWSREIHGQLLNNLSNARVIAFDLLFLESADADAEFIEAIQAVRQSNMRTKIILGAAGFQSSNAQNALYFDRLLLPILYESVDNVGIVNTFGDIDNTIRRQPSLIYTTNGEKPYVSFSLAVYLAYLRLSPLSFSQLMTYEGDTLRLTSQTPPIHIDENGLWMQNYFGKPGTFPIISYQDVIESNFDPALFEDKIVLVGVVDAAGITDQYAVPTSNGELMPGVEIQAHAIETLIQHNPLQAQSRTSEIMMILGLSIFSALVYARPRWYFKLGIMLCLLLIWMLIASTIFTFNGLVINLWYASLAIAMPGLIVIGLDITEEIRRREHSEFLLESLVQASEQQLNPERILELLKKDIQKLIPGSTVNIYENQRNSSHTMQLPIKWQGKVLRYITVDANERITERSQTLVMDLLKRIAPSLENAHLFAETQRQNELLETILKESPQSVVILGDDLSVRRSNLGFKRLVPLDLADQSLPALFALMSVENTVVSELLFQFETGKPFQQEIQIDQKTYNLAAAPLKAYEQWMVMLVDITQLAELNKLKTRMIRMASHDLKNPLARINGYVQLILMDEDTLEAETLKFLQNIQKASDEMIQIISDILDIEQLRSGKIDKERVNLTAITHDVVSRHFPDAEQKNQTLTSELASGVIVMGNLRQLSQVVSNLVGNAIKYTPAEGTIHVTLRVEDDDTFVEVKDSGYGIPKESQAQLFTEFYRVRTRQTAGIPGTGLGLSLVKSVLQAHRGDVWVESEEDQGSTFYMRIPLEEWESPC